MMILRDLIPDSQTGSILELPNKSLGIVVNAGEVFPFPGIALFHRVPQKVLDCEMLAPLDDSTMFVHFMTMYWQVGRLMPSKRWAQPLWRKAAEHVMQTHWKAMGMCETAGVEVPPWAEDYPG